MEEAKKLGAIALFGEKYGDKVRVVQFGSSIEFCGGCHAQSTGRIGMVRIVSESSVAAGVRRIEAVTGKAVEALMDKQQDLVADLRAMFNNVPDLVSTVRKAIDDNAELRHQVDEYKAQRAQQYKAELIEKAREINGMKVISGIILADAQSAKDIAFQLRNQFSENLVVVIGTIFAEKPSLTVCFSDDLVAGGLNAGTLVREAGRLIKGGGGGQAHFATAGGKDPEGILSAVEKVVELVTNK